MVNIIDLLDKILNKDNPYVNQIPNFDYMEADGELFPDTLMNRILESSFGRKLDEFLQKHKTKQKNNINEKIINNANNITKNFSLHVDSSNSLAEFDKNNGIKNFETLNNIELNKTNFIDKNLVNKDFNGFFDVSSKNVIENSLSDSINGLNSNFFPIQICQSEETLKDKTNNLEKINTSYFTVNFYTVNMYKEIDLNVLGRMLSESFLEAQSNRAIDSGY